MATTNLFNLLDNDAEDPSLLIAAAQEMKVSAVSGGAVKKVTPPGGGGGGGVAKLPSKPLPPSQAVREARNEGGRGGAGRGGRGYGRGRGAGGANRDSSYNDEQYTNGNGVAMPFKEDREKPFERRGGYGSSRGGYRGGRRGGFGDGEVFGEGERQKRVFERHSGTGRGGEIKREGAGRGNWGTATDEFTQVTEEPLPENEAVHPKKPAGEDENVDVEKQNPEKEAEEVEPEEKQMTLEEYEKVLEEKRKALLSLKGEERKVDVDKEFESMQLVSKKKKNDDEVFIKLGSEKDKRKDAAEKEERAKKSVSINEFLKPADGDGYYNRRGGRGRGRGRGGYGNGNGYGYNNASAPSIEDPSHFPSLGGK